MSYFKSRRLIGERWKSSGIGAIVSTLGAVNLAAFSGSRIRDSRSRGMKEAREAPMASTTSVRGD
jgi:hypothetical protein